MQKPHMIDDPRTGGFYLVLADRELSQQEVEQLIRIYLQGGGKRPARGETKTITTVLGT